MSPAFRTRRRAEEFDRLVDSAGGEARPGGEFDELVSLATALRARPSVEPRAEFSADLRERLMAAAATDLVPATGAAPHELTVAERLTVRRLGERTSAGRRQRRLTAGVVAAVIIAGTAGTAYASQDSLPGDTLYPVKRAVENVRSDLSRSDGSKGSTILGDAGTRLTEVQKLTKSSGSSDAGQVSKTLQTFSSQATQASDLLLSDYRQHRDPAAIKKLRSFTARGIDQLAALDALVPASAKGAVTDAAQTLLLIDQAAASLCPDCGTGITELPSTLLSGLSATLDDVAPGLLPGNLAGGEDTTPEASGATNPPKTQPSTTSNGPAITLPSVDPGSLLPGSLTGLLGAPASNNGDDSTSTNSDNSGSTANSNGSKDSGSTDSGSTDSGSGNSGSSGSGGSSTPKPKPTSIGDALGGTVDGVVNGVGGLLGSVVGGLTGSGS